MCSTFSGRTPTVGRAVAYAGSAYGTTVLRPSLPPASCRTTRTRSLWMPSMPAANTPLARTGGTITPLAAPTRPAARKSRRVTLIGGTSFQLELGAGEQGEPAVGWRLGGAEGRGGVLAEHTVEVGAHRRDRVGQRGAVGQGR